MEKLPEELPKAMLKWPKIKQTQDLLGIEISLSAGVPFSCFDRLEHHATMGNHSKH